MDIRPAAPLITYRAQGEILNEWPVFAPVWDPERRYLAVAYEALFTWEGGQWTTRAIQLTGRQERDGKPAGRTKTAHLHLSSETTPDWVHALVDRIRPATLRQD